jgi:hypothetical protein
VTKEAFAARFAEESQAFSDEELCRQLKISQPTIRRWREGASAPHELGRESVFQLLAKMRDETR